MHMCTLTVMTDRERSLGVAAHLHRSVQRVPVPVLTLWECVSLGTCLIEGGKLTHSLCKQAHMAIITLIYGGEVGEMQEDRVGRTRLERKIGMERTRRRGATVLPLGGLCSELLQGPTRLRGKQADAPVHHLLASQSGSEKKG